MATPATESRSSQFAPEYGDASFLHLMSLLHRISSLIHRDTRKVTRRYELTWVEFEILTTLLNSENRSATPGVLKDQLMVSSGGMTNLIKDLVARGYLVIRRSEEDKRIRIIELDSSGEQIANEILEILERKNANIYTKILSSDERKALESNLAKLLEGLLAKGVGNDKF